MYLRFLSILFFVFLFLSSSYSQTETTFEQYWLQKEENPSLYILAKQTAINSQLPISIYTETGIFIEVLTFENNEILYSVVYDAARPVESGEVLTYDQIKNKFNLSEARINYGKDKIINEEVGLPDFKPVNTEEITKFLLVPDWTDDRVMAYDYLTGDILDLDYIPSSPGNLASPKEALLNKNGFISVSDQITDLIQKYDTSGAYLGILAPAGGVNIAQLDNARGHSYRPNGNVIVTIGSSANQNSVAEFDTAGAYVGQFITTGLGGLNSPFGILYRSADILVTGSSSDAVHRYNYDGSYISDLVTGINFPQQVAQLSGGRIGVAVFSSPSGVGIYDSLGTQLQFLTGVSGPRSVYQLANGNYLTTNGTGIHEIDGTSGTLVRTIFASNNLQYITLIDYAIIPVELTSFTAEASNGNVTLNWQTATETNNNGFFIERSSGKVNFEQLDFIKGSGTTTQPQTYSFVDKNVNGGKYYYRLKQVDFDGSVTYAGLVEVTVLNPFSSYLEQNYPNPFNPVTTINYQVANDSKVTLKVYDILGNEIAVLVDEFKTTGRYNIQFDASSITGLSSGIYYYTLNAGNYSATKKLMLLK